MDQTSHRVRDSQFLKVALAFRRNKLSAQFWSRKFFLFDEEHANAVARQMYSGTRSRRSRAGDDHIQIVHFIRWVGSFSRCFAVNHSWIGSSMKRRSMSRTF